MDAIDMEIIDMEIIKRKGVYKYPLYLYHGFGYNVWDVFRTIKYTHEIRYKNSLYYFGKTDNGDIGILESETGAFAVSNRELPNKPTEIEPYIKKWMKMEKDSGKSMPQIIQTFKQKINYLELWETELFIGL